MILKYSSEPDFNDIKFAYAYGENNNYFMLHRKCIPIQQNETSTLRNEYGYLDKKDKELKGENEGVVEYGNDFTNCKITSDNNSD